MGGDLLVSAADGGPTQGHGRDELARWRERAQGMVEYALILMLIALVVLAITQVLGKQVNNVFSNISNGVSQ